MTSELNIMWIKTQDNQLTLKPNNKSVLRNVFPASGSIISYDNQAQYPWTTTITSARELQSSLGDKYELNASLLNLSAVLRNKFQNKTWKNDYLSDIVKYIPYGQSKI